MTQLIISGWHLLRISCTAFKFHLSTFCGRKEIIHCHQHVGINSEQGVDTLGMKQHHKNSRKFLECSGFSDPTGHQLEVSTIKTFHSSPLKPNAPRCCCFKLIPVNILKIIAFEDGSLEFRQPILTKQFQKRAFIWRSISS